MNNSYFNPKYPTAPYLRERARQRIPGFAFDYLEGGNIAEMMPSRNQQALQGVCFANQLLKPRCQCSLKVQLMGREYDYPFGIAPVGLQGVMWPKGAELLAQAARKMNIPFVLSTVSSASLETIAQIAEENAWFQFYNPTAAEVRADLLKRLKAAQYQVMMVTVDVPTFGFRPKDVRNGLSMPPGMTLRNVLQMLTRPRWLLDTARAGKPQMHNLTPYMPKHMPVDQFQSFMNKTVMGAVDIEALKMLRDSWPGKLVVKGISEASEAKALIDMGVDGIVISNHGGRQLDAGRPSIEALASVYNQLGTNRQAALMFDSGIRCGTDIVRALGTGADFTFLGRLFMYGVAALDKNGGEHVVNMLARQLDQVVHQLGVRQLSELRALRLP